MAIFKRNRDGGGGEVWYVQVADHNGVKRRMAAFKSRSASDELERAILRLVSARQVNGTLAAEDNRFIESAPARIRDKLAAWGIIESTRAAAGHDLSTHVDAWVKHLVAEQNSPRHCKQCRAKMTRILSECKIQFLTDVQADVIEDWLAEQRSAGMSNRTSNSHLSTFRAFLNWMIKRRMLTANPLHHLKKLNEAIDKRHQRRAFTDDEVARLLKAAMIAEANYGLTGPERVLLYWLSLDTGLRYSEIRSLNRSSFNFTVTPATVFLAAKDAKNGKEPRSCCWSRWRRNWPGICGSMLRRRRRSALRMGRAAIC